MLQEKEVLSREEINAIDGDLNIISPYDVRQMIEDLHDEVFSRFADRGIYE